MDIEEALEKVGRFLCEATLEDGFKEFGNDAWFALPSIRYLYQYAKAVRATPSTHDSQAEFNAWDEFFAERKESANGES